MAPERIKGSPNSIQTDLYALGVILYQILALQLPFQRKTISSFRKTVDSEEITGPIEAAPYREIPHQLAAIAMKCLAKDPAERFQSVEELIDELKKSIEGRPEWILAGELNLKEKEHWQFQENVLLAKHLAITHNFDVTQWAALSISKMTFENNLRLDAKVKVSSKSKGIGFLLSVPNPGERESLEEGYLLWVGPENHPSCQLFRNNVQVLEAAKIYLHPNEWHRVRIEKIDDHLKFYLDGELKLSFVSHLPLTGKHVGILVKDDCFEIQYCKVYDGSHNVMVGCMAVPNAFLSHRLFSIALEEYRRIAQCFPGRMEGRDALFRAGLTLLEQAKCEKDQQTQDELFHLALKEFEKLYRTPGAPFEYLGKSLIYQAMNEAEEEAKCLELALRKFPRHPLLFVLKEQIIYRMHESSLNNREAAYRIILLAIRHIPDLLNNPDTRDLIDSLKRNWEPLPFIEGPANSLTEIAIQLAFWLAKVPILVEIAKGLFATGSNEIALCNALHALLELEATDEVKQLLNEVVLSPQRKKSIEIALLTPNEGTIQKALHTKTEIRTFYHLLRGALKQCPPALVRETIEKCFKKKTAEFTALELWSLLLEKKWDEAEALIKKLKKNSFTEENSPLHFPYGCWLYIREGQNVALSHFSGALDTPYPATPALPSHFLTGRINEKEGWIERAFWWEKKELYRQIDLFYKIIGKKNGKAKNS
jgi:serine/threonine-protein kinase